MARRSAPRAVALAVTGARLVLPLPLGPDLLRRVRARVGGSVAVRDHLQPALPGAGGRAHGAPASGRCSRPTTRPSRGAAAGRGVSDAAAAPDGAAPGAALAVVFLDGDYEDPALLPRPRRAGGRSWWSPPTAAPGFLARAGRPPRRGRRRLRLAAGEPPWSAWRRRASSSSATPCARTSPTASWPSTRRCAAAPASCVLAGALGALDHTLGHLAILRRLAARGVAARLVAPRPHGRACSSAPAEAALDAPRRHARLPRAAGGRRAR